MGKRKQNQRKRKTQKITINTIAIASASIVLLAMIYGIFFPPIQQVFFRLAYPYSWYIYGFIPFGLIGLFCLNEINKRNGRKPFEENSKTLSINLAVIAVIGMLGFGANMIINDLTGIRLTGSLALGIFPLLLYPYLKIRKSNVNLFFDYAIIFFLFVHGMSKLGCHTVGCCFGVDMNHTIFSRSYYPVQLMEATANILPSFLMLWYLSNAKRPVSGILYPTGMLLHAVAHLLLDFIRVPRGERIITLFNGQVSLWQLMSIVYIVAGGI